MDSILREYFFYDLASFYAKERVLWRNEKNTCNSLNFSIFNALLITFFYEQITELRFGSMGGRSR